MEGLMGIPRPPPPRPPSPPPSPSIPARTAWLLVRGPRLPGQCGQGKNEPDDPVEFLLFDAGGRSAKCFDCGANFRATEK